jgi:predicted metal-binding protein
MLHGLIDAYRRLAEHPGDFEEAILKLVGFGTCLFCHGSVDDLVRG